MNAPLLVREVERIARERGWSHSRLARELGVDPTTLSRVRTGRGPLSQPLLVRIGAVFTGSTIQKLILHYLLVEAPPWYVTHRKRAEVDGYEEVPYMVRWRIRRWITGLDAASTPQRGIYLTGGDAKLLSAAARFVRVEAEAHGHTAVVLRANDRLSASHAKAALDADLLIVERVEFVSEAVTRLIEGRSAALKPMVVTGSHDREQLADPYLVRVFRAWTETITVSQTRNRQPHTHVER